MIALVKIGGCESCQIVEEMAPKILQVVEELVLTNPSEVWKMNRRHGRKILFPGKEW
jgi:hypothetical protein